MWQMAGFLLIMTRRSIIVYNAYNNCNQVV